MNKKTIVMTLITFCFYLTLSASNISLNFGDVTVRSAIEALQERGYSIVFLSDDVDTQRIVSVNLENGSIDEAMKQILYGQNDLTYEINNRSITLRKVERTVAQQQSGQITVRGTVIDEYGEDVIGATIQVRGTTQGTVTDFNGNFTLSAPAGAMLVVSFVGYIAQEVPVRENVRIILIPDSEILGELVVTALGIRRERKALGYAVQNLEGDRLQTVRGVDVGTSLTGRIAGLNVLNPTEFGDGPTILLRGAEPLLVIDGVPFAHMTLREVAPDDIESLSVLKGAAASALYGTRGQNGAIMVTTKRGAGKAGTSISVNSGTMFTAGFLAIPELQSTFGRRIRQNPDGTLEHIRSTDDSWGPVLDGREVIQWCGITKTMRAMPNIARGKDNFRNFLEQGHILHNNVNIAQSGEHGNIRASATWVNNKGVYPNSTLNRYTYSLGGDIRLNNVSLSSNLSYSKRQSPNLGFNGYTGYDPMYTLLVWAAPDWDIRDFRDYWLIPNQVQNNSYTATNNNPYFDRFERTNAMNRDIFNGMFEMKYEPSKFFNTLVRVGYDTYSERRDVRISQGSFVGGGSETVIQGGSEIWGESQRGSYNLGISRGYGINADFINSGNYQFRDFTVDGFVGGSIMYSQDEGMESFTRGGLSIPGFYSLRASINPVLINSRIFRRQTNSLFGRIGLSYQSLAFIEATLRNDWASTLAESERSYLYPSISGSFIASELLPKTNWLSLWQLRASWVTSKRPAGIYAINSVYTISNNTWGTLSSSRVPTTIRGRDVFPESIENVEFGTAVHLLENRLSFDVAYYNRRAFDFLRNASISPTSGYTTNFVNIDEEITRRGVELTVNATPVRTRDIRWDVTFNWSKYADYYTRLDEQHSLDRPWIEVGKRADAFVFRDHQRDPDGNLIHNAQGLPIRATWDSKMGYRGPDWIWGFSTNFSYQNWQLGVSLDGRVGGQIETVTEMYMWRAGSHPKSVVPERFLDAENPGTRNFIGQGVKIVSGDVQRDTHGNIIPGTDTRVFAPNDNPATFQSYVNALHAGTAWGGLPSKVDVFSGTFLKLREISLTYNVPRAISAQLKAEQLSVSLVGQNVLFWAKDFKYSDPDGGTENFADPSQRFLGFNIRMNF
jgi:TonB-linked SusC/RagA family outer membrane protein